MRPATSTRDQLDVMRSRPLAYLVQQEIERQILSGELRAGERLNELEIARHLGISRAPVRECLRTLEQIGLVVIRKNYGVYVRTVSIEEVREIYQVRSYIDAGIGQELARHIAADDFAALERLMDRMELASAAGDADMYHELNMAFHEKMVASVGNAKLLAIYRKLLKELTLYRRRSLGQPGAMASSAQEHRALLNAMRSGKPEVAGKAMRDHILASSDRLQRAHEPAASAAADQWRRKGRK